MKYTNAKRYEFSRGIPICLYICEAIYDKTRPPMFTDIEEIDY